MSLSKMKEKLTEPIGQVTFSVDGRPEFAYGWLTLSQATRLAEDYGLRLDRA